MIVNASVLFLLLQAAPFVPGAVAGQLRSIDGAPAVAVRVVAVPVPTGTTVPDEGPNYFNLAPPTAATLTDNEGNFRLQELRPGRYYLMAGTAGQATYFPGAGHINDAQPINVSAGFIVENLNLKLLHRLGGKLSGRINANLATIGSKTATLTGGKLDEILEVPLAADGAFEFGHVPPGLYLLSVYPPPSGMASVPVQVGDADITGLQLVPLPTSVVTGRIIAENGPIPWGLLGFYTEQSYVGAVINPDGSFSVRLHAAHHQIDFAGIPVGYSVASVKLGSQDVSRGFTVGNSDLSGIVVTLKVSRRLAPVSGQITGLPPARLSSTSVELTGPIVGSLEAPVKADGSFGYEAVTPGLYRLRLVNVPEFAPMLVVVQDAEPTEVKVVVPSR